MSVQQFEKGDRVRKATVEHTVLGPGYSDHGEEYAKKGAVGTVVDVEAPAVFWVEWDEGTPCRIHAQNLEPEDKADLYVEPVTEPSVDNSEAATEPEPLKEDDAVLVWARVVDAKPDSDGEVEVFLQRADGYQVSYATTYTLPDAIVRPDAGQVPPWVKPARCTSLWADPFATDPTTLRRCKFDAGHDERHRADWSAPTGHNQSATWADGGAYGRVEVSS